MIIFLNDDRAYLYWVTHHRQGFVLDGRRKPKLGHLVVHRATCQEIKSTGSRRTHWTSGSKLKACCSNRTELEAWAAEETGASPERCPKCDFESQASPSGEVHTHLSKLARDVLEYILEAALIHLEIEHPPYHVTVGDISACFGKTPGQISPVLHRLLEGGFLTVQGHVGTAAAFPPKRVVLPTVTALRTLEAFRTESDSTIQDELAKLEPG
jgi:hypothetical protein